MAEIYKLIHPVKHFNDYISLNVRSDGRKFSEQRNIKLNVDSIKTAEASAVVKCGNTTIVCGIQLELATPKAEEPNIGYLVTNVELPALCSARFKPGPPSDYSQVTSNLVSDIVVNSKCINLEDLCIVPDKLCWVLYCDMICIDNDGSLVDACLISLMTSLRSLSLPTVIFDPETEEIEVDSSQRKRLEVHGLPIATSFSLYTHNQRNILLTDPTLYEEEMCGGLGANLIVCYNKDSICGLQKFGGSNFPVECQDEALKISEERYNIIKKVIDVCLKTYYEENSIENK